MALDSVIPSDKCPRYTKKFSQAIGLQEDTGVVRHPGLVGFSVPFSREADVHSLTGFYLTTLDGKALPTQMEVLSRWGDAPDACKAPIRWAYGWARVDVKPKDRAYLVLRHKPNKHKTYGPIIEITDDAESTLITTGPARFTILKRRFNGLSKAEVKSDQGWVSLMDGLSDESAGMLLQHDKLRASASFAAPSSYEIERNGPHVATIAVKGTYSTKGKDRTFRYTVRFHFYSGTGVVQVDHTYYFGKVKNDSPDGAQIRTLSDRVFMRMPIDVGPTPQVMARLVKKPHTFIPKETVAVLQDKRTPQRTKVVSSIIHGKKNVELGVFADRPLLGVFGKKGWVAATIAFMGPRDPQAMHYDPKTGNFDIDWQSEELFIGGARGVWSKAVLEFGTTPNVLAERGTQLYLHGARPLIGITSTKYTNSTKARTRLPTSELSGGLSKFDADVDRMHDRTFDFLRQYKVTGSQIWPDLPRTHCSFSRSCYDLENGYYGGGDTNYWDWSMIELDQFMRTADPVFIHDFAYPEAMTLAETITWRPDPDVARKLNFAGFSPCYGPSDVWGPWREGYNHRVACPGDYSYNKVYRYAYLLTADRRFTDLFDQAGRSVIFNYGKKPKRKVPEYKELAPGRLVFQFLEQLLNAAEFNRIGGTKRTRMYRDTVLRYFDFMTKNALERGHVCYALGSKYADPKLSGNCESVQAWMLPVFIDWVVRLERLYDHAPAKKWLLDHFTLTANLFGKRDADGDLGGRGAFRTIYTCKANKKSVRDDTCEQLTDIEAGGRFYDPGWVAYLNAWGLVLGAIDGDPLKICQWLPGAYSGALARMNGEQSNNYYYGKATGQAYALSQPALGAIEQCK